MNIFGSNKELQILKRFGRGDASAMDMLYADYADYLTGVCCRYIGNEDDRKDVLQEAFIKIFTSIGHFSYRGEGSLKAWVTRIAVNEALQYLRQQCRWSPIDSDAPLPHPAAAAWLPGRVQPLCHRGPEPQRDSPTVGHHTEHFGLPILQGPRHAGQNDKGKQKIITTHRHEAEEIQLKPPF